MTANDFATECLERGICPACLNAGDSPDDDLDLFGHCGQCGTDVAGKAAGRHLDGELWDQYPEVNR